MNGPVVFRASVIENIRRHVSQGYPEECCGLLFSKNIESGEVIIGESVEVTKGYFGKDRYEMDPLRLAGLENSFRERGFEIAGFYHSHPDTMAVISKEDDEMMIPGMLYMIIPVYRGLSGRYTVWMKKDPDEAAVLKSCKED